MSFKLKSGNKLPSFKMMGSSPLLDQDDRKHTHEDGQKWFEKKTTTNEDGSTSWTQAGSEGGSDENKEAIKTETKRKRSGGKSYEKAWEAMSPEDQEKAGGFGAWYKKAVAFNKAQIKETEEPSESSVSTLKPLERSGSTPVTEVPEEEDPGGGGGGSGGGGGGGKKKKKKKFDWSFLQGSSGGDCGNPNRPCWDQ